MNKGLEIFLLVLLFCVCGIIGYFGCEMLVGNGDAAPAEKIVEPELIEVEPLDEPIESPKPTIMDAKCELISSGNGGSYRLTIIAGIDSAEELVYVLYKDKEFTDQISDNYIGVFENLPSTPSGKYYVKVHVEDNAENYDYAEISGFDRVHTLVSPISAQELQASINGTSDGSVPSDISNRFAASQNVYCNGKLYANNFTTLWMDVFMGVAKYQVINVKHDTYNKLTEIHVKTM